MSKLTYIRCGDYDIPNLKLSEQPETSIGKYGRMRKSYLKEHRPILYNQLLMSEKPANVFRARRFASRAALTSAPKVSKPGQSSTFAI